jgi:hypothetical protein
MTFVVNLDENERVKSRDLLRRPWNGDGLGNFDER